jgi:hypothetical protein
LKKQVEFLGHVLSAEGVAVDPSKVHAVQEWEQPKLATKICSFLIRLQCIHNFLCSMLVFTPFA